MSKSVFQLQSKFPPAGDQPQAIEKLLAGLSRGDKHQTLLGVTGSGKTFTAANVIAKVGKPTLVIAHNKTLAAQLCNEFREFFPRNAVEYFVSYYDYYQPEAYMPTSDTYIDKEAMINEEIDKLRHSATASLLTRQDVIVVASVSCIYGLGAPEEYRKNILRLRAGDALDRAATMRKLVDLQFSRTTTDLTRGTFRLRGEHWEIMPPGREIIFLIEAPGGIIQKIYEVDPVKGFEVGVTPEVSEALIAPAKHFITPPEDRERAIKAIRMELKERLKKFEHDGKLLEAERLERRTNFDLAMMREVGYCHGIENYSRHLSGRNVGDAPATLFDYFPKDFLLVIDESHVTVPQIGGMSNGDAARKKTLIEYGFRLPSAADNRPLRFHEFEERVKQCIYTSATPGEYEKQHSAQVVEQIIRPTGLIDPRITILPALGQVQDLIPRIVERVKKNERVLVTTLTKKMAEDLSSYLAELPLNDDSETKNVKKVSGTKKIVNRKSKIKNVKVAYLHSDVKTLDRVRILTDLRRGNFDVLVGVNLLREGLDLPEVTLVAILDADKEGFLRSETSLIQTIGRAARNVAGEVLLYADIITGSIERAVSETNRRRDKQIAYNKEHGITPQTIIKEIRDILPARLASDSVAGAAAKLLATELAPIKGAFKTKKSLEKLIKEKELEMRRAAQTLEFELAALLRDEIKLLTKELGKQSKTKN